MGEVVQKVQDILREVVQDGLSVEEIERAKQKIASALVLRSEKPLGRLLPVAMAWEYRGEYLNADEAADRILSVTKEDVDALLADDPFAKGTFVAFGPLETLET